MGTQGSATFDKSARRVLSAIIDRRAPHATTQEDPAGGELAEDYAKQVETLAHRQRSVELLLAGDGRGMMPGCRRRTT